MLGKSPRVKIGFHETLKLLDRHLPVGDGEPTGNHDPVGHLVVVPVRLFGGEPMRNSTGPSITAKVCPWLLMNQRRSPRSLTFIN